MSLVTQESITVQSSRYDSMHCDWLEHRGKPTLLTYESPASSTNSACLFIHAFTQQQQQQKCHLKHQGWEKWK